MLCYVMFEVVSHDTISPNF